MSKVHKVPEKVKEADQAGEVKKPEAKKSDPVSHSSSPSRAKGHEALPGGCVAWNCKGHAMRFNFCEEHYDHFKFGLIKKTGEPVSDYEKKIEHYAAYKSKQGAKRAA